MSGNCGTALGLWIKNRGEKKNNLLLKRRSLALLSSAIPGARQGLHSLPGPPRGPHQQLRPKPRGPPVPTAAEGVGGPKSGAGPHCAHPTGSRASSSQPHSWTGGRCHQQTQRSVPGMAASPSCPKDTLQGHRGGVGAARWRATSAKTTWGRAGLPLASSLSSPMEGSDPTSSTGFLPQAWTGSKEQCRERVSAAAGSQQHVFGFRATLDGCMRTQAGRADSVGLAACWKKGKV